MGKKIKAWAAVLMILVLCVTMVTAAYAQEEITPYAYRETLLVSYEEYWFVDGSGEDIYVRQAEVYREYQFPHGYRELAPIIAQLPITGDYPAETTKRQRVTKRYEFY